MPSHTTSALRRATVAIILLGAGMIVHVSHAVAQNSEVTWQTFRIERNADPGKYITFEPPSTPISPYSITWPASGPGSGLLFISQLASPDSVLLTGAISTDQLIEVQSIWQMNIRRKAIILEGGGPQATPGYVASDFQGSRTGGQTATGDRSIIMGGSSNAVSASVGAIGGGQGNAVSGTSSAILGGSANAVSGYAAGILGGTSNAVSATRGVLMSGYDNAVSGHAGVVLGGSDNAVSANQGFLGGGASNANSGDNATLFGGYDNATSGTHAILFGGWHNSVSSTNEATLIGGMNNAVSGNNTFVGAGYNNAVSSDQVAVFGGMNNTASGNQSTLLGGRQNQISGSQGTIMGGQANRAAGGSRVTIGGGRENQSSSNYATLNGGYNNTISAQYGTIMGGQNATYSGQDGLLFNGSSRAFSVSTTGIFAINNTDIWIANNNGTPTAVRFYEAQSGTGAFPAAATAYVGFTAPSSTAGSSDNTYTMPGSIVTTAGRKGLVISASPAPTTTTASTEWSVLKAYTVTGVTATAATTNIAAASLNADQPVKINPNNTPANRRITLSNGSTDGMVVTLYVYNATAGNGVRLYGADANLALAGAANADLNQLDSITLVWDNTSTKWIEIGRSAN